MVKGPAATDVTVRIRRPVIQVESFVAVDRDFVVMFVTIRLSKIVMCNMKQLYVPRFKIKIALEMISNARVIIVMRFVFSRQIGADFETCSPNSVRLNYSLFGQS